MTPSAPGLGTAPAALSLNLSTRQYEENPDGSLVSVDPTDHAVDHALGFELGSVPSARTMGHDLRNRLASASPEAWNAIAVDEARTRLASLIDAKRITLDSSTVQETDVPGRLLWIVEYTNLITGESRQVRR